MSAKLKAALERAAKIARYTLGATNHAVKGCSSAPSNTPKDATRQTVATARVKMPHSGDKLKMVGFHAGYSSLLKILFQSFLDRGTRLRGGLIAGSESIRGAEAEALLAAIGTIDAI